MGKFIAYKCINCDYEETQIGVGSGKRSEDSLSLFVCAKCQTIGSTWVKPGHSPLCSLCYDEGITLLSADVQQQVCPKCGRPGFFTALPGEWE